MPIIDIDELAQQIINSDDIELSFSKVASDLDKEHKITLAREVNKLNFLRNLANADINENIEFPLIEGVEGLNKTASLNNISSENITKTASILTKTAEEKRKVITPDMFLLKEENVIRHSNKPSYSHTDTISKTASEKFNEELEYLSVKKELEKQAEEQNLISKAEVCKVKLIDKIASITDDASEMRSVLKLMVKEGGQKYIPSVLNASKVSSSYVQQVRELPIDIHMHKTASEAVKTLKEIDEALEKKAVASLGNLVRKVTNVTSYPIKATAIAGKQAIKGAGMIGKQVIKHPILSTALVSGANASSKADEEVIKKVLGY